MSGRAGVYSVPRAAAAAAQRSRSLPHLIFNHCYPPLALLPQNVVQQSGLASPKEAGDLRRRTGRR